MALNLHLPSYFFLLALPLALGEASPVARKSNKKDQSQSVSTDKTGNIIAIVGLVLVIIVISINILIAYKLRQRERREQERLAATESSATLTPLTPQTSRVWEPPAWTPPQAPGSVTTITATRPSN
ncbi:unnamed protein product [Clonostachys rosea f. rosea IK726]|uniref:Uncharacterized protein n=1 Tax=Clonostachys rosea f. rosea IK726 TaxID=1349383 RepID=A0ACA9TEQ1_BIOOC|nr:unnamed protein product [Clonostachys rosea f. rosea IK726]